MITCFLHYELRAGKQREFESYARRWLKLVERYGGTHHGYYMPCEGASDLAIALFSFPSLAEYERYRTLSADDPECQQAYDYAETHDCFRRYDRQFLQRLEP